MTHNLEKEFYKHNVPQTLDLLATSEQGLSDVEVKQRRELYGENVLTYRSRDPRYKKIMKQLKDPMIILLIVAGLLALYLGDGPGATVLALIILVNTTIGYMQEQKAENIMKSLKTMLHTSAKAKRNGELVEVNIKNLVPGDIVYIEEGEAIPADLRLIQVTHLMTNDFSLTGESNPVRKHTQTINGNVPLGDRNNVAFMGTTVATGNAYGVVIATGMHTQLGTIANLAHKDLIKGKTPLQRELANVARKLTIATIIIAVVLAGVALAVDFTLYQAFIFGIGIAAAMVPQGLPAQVTVALSLAATRLAKRGALVKELGSVETLGCINVICTDKTGTLTKNEMTVSHVFLPSKKNGKFEISGIGYEPQGQIKNITDPLKSEHRKRFLYGCALASNARINPPDEEHATRYAIGDPTEAALLTLAEKGGLDVKELDREHPESFEFSFDSVRKRMSSIRQIDKEYYLLVKGAPSAVLERSSHIMHDERTVILRKKETEEIQLYVDEMASGAMRNIATAYRNLTDKEIQRVKKYQKLIKKQNDTTHTTSDMTDMTQKLNELVDDFEKNLIFLGVASIIDPPRESALHAVQAAHDAKIKVVMITGDYALTAKAIAEKIGLANDEGQIKLIYNKHLKQKTDIKLIQDLQNNDVIFSRTSPEDKLRIVQLLKKTGKVVAVTGDGINDAPALRNADIGVAMGKIGTDVAKDSSQIVLMDDSFATLVGAIKEGRVIYRNLRKTIMASMTTNGGELGIVVISLLIASLTGLPIAITAVQILAIDLIGEMLPLIALTWDPAEKGIMHKQPRNIHRHILDSRTITTVITTGLYMGGLAFAAYFAYGWLNGVDLRSISTDSTAYKAATTVTYTSIVLSQFFNIMSIRTGATRSVFNSYALSNPRLLMTFGISLVLVLIVMYVPAISNYFGFGALSATDWLIPITAAVLYVLGREGWKYIYYGREKNM